MTVGDKRGPASDGGKGEDEVHRISHISEPRDVVEIPNHSHLEPTLFLVHPAARFVLLPSVRFGGVTSSARAENRRKCLNFLFHGETVDICHSRSSNSRDSWINVIL